jgi:D-arabinose 1-dehydrogenase-like Zn-dependent alcohol dehydrogenase
MTGRETNVSIHQTYLRHISLLGLYLGEKHELQELVKMVSNGSVKPLIHGKYDLKDAGEAHKLMGEGKTVGKLVLIP